MEYPSTAAAATTDEAQRRVLINEIVRGAFTATNLVILVNVCLVVVGKKMRSLK